jgi:hypothetical protein
LEEFFAWIFHNKEWLFSGVGLMVVAWVGRLIFKKTYASSTQTIRSGNNSTNIQAGRDVSIGMKKKGNDVEEE